MTATYCLLDLNYCYSLEDWNNIAIIFATYTAVPGVLIAAWKTWSEINKSRVEREEDHLLKRIEFTLAQHRRLFDDPVLFSVLALIDSDDEKLLEMEMWDPKRKLLTFFEEIALLVHSRQIQPTVAYYMFGYYATRARDGESFKEGIDLEVKYWGLFFEFCENAQYFLDNFETKNVKNLKF